jgi:hypothetical protein
MRATKWLLNACASKDRRRLSYTAHDMSVVEGSVASPRPATRISASWKPPTSASQAASTKSAETPAVVHRLPDSDQSMATRTREAPPCAGSIVCTR